MNGPGSVLSSACWMIEPNERFLFLKWRLGHCKLHSKEFQLLCSVRKIAGKGFSAADAWNSVESNQPNSFRSAVGATVPPSPFCPLSVPPGLVQFSSVNPSSNAADHICEINNINIIISCSIPKLLDRTG